MLDVNAKKYNLHLKKLVQEAFAEVQRKSKDITIAKFAERCSVSVSTINKLLDDTTVNDTFPEYKTLLGLSHGLSLSPDYLMGFYDNIDDIAIYLRNLFISADKLNFKFSFDNDNKSIHLVSEDKHVFYSIQQSLSNSQDIMLTEFKNGEEIEIGHVVELFAPLEFLKGELIPKTDYEEFKKTLYLYGHRLDIDDYSEEDYHLFKVQYFINALEKARRFDHENDEEYQLKLIEWEKSLNNPTKHFSDIYLWFFPNNE